ncbi:MAG: ATP-binding protein [Terracoccus sp.]
MTTHDWAKDVDRAHLVAIQDRRDLYGAGGVRHLILEVLSYANDEAESLGRVGRARVIMRPNATVTVVDDGRGTDTRTDSEGHVIRKPVMATKDIRFFDSVNSPRLPDGLPRRGMSTVAALSTELVHENHRTHGSWSQTYRQGIPEDQLRQLRKSDTTGTSVTFRTDVEGPDALTAGDLAAFPWLHVEVDQPSVSFRSRLH